MEIWTNFVWHIFHLKLFFNPFWLYLIPFFSFSLLINFKFSHFYFFHTCISSFPIFIFFTPSVEEVFYNAKSGLFYSVGLGWVLWYINYCWLFNTETSLCINKINRIQLVWVLGHIEYCCLYNAKSFLYICIIYKYYLVWVGFNKISTIVGNLMLNPVFPYISNIYDL